MTRPELRAVALAEVLPPRGGVLYVTMSRGQWDALLAAAYAADCVLLELDDKDEEPVRAFRLGGTSDVPR